MAYRLARKFWLPQPEGSGPVIFHGTKAFLIKCCLIVEYPHAVYEIKPDQVCVNQCVRCHVVQVKTHFFAGGVTPGNAWNRCLAC